MKLQSLLVIFLATLVTLPMLQAQDEGNRRGGDRGDRGDRGGGGFGGGMFGMGMGIMGVQSGAAQLLGMLNMDEVRKELGVTEEVYASIQEVQQQTFGKIRGLRDASEDERKKITEEINTTAQQLLDEVLSDTKLKRLMGLYIQSNGSQSVTNDLIAKEIGLDQATKDAIAKEMQSIGEKMREQFAGMRGGGGGSGERPDFSKIQEQMSKIREDTSKAVESKLSADHKKALEALKGEKFNFPTRQFGGFGGPGGGRRPGGERN
jgi:hypothetical protein